MKFTVERAVLIKALAHVQSVVERRNTIPILANVLLAAQDDGALRLTATDMEIAVVEEVPGVQVSRPGRATAPAATLYEIVRKLPEGSDVSLSFTGEDPRLTVAAGRSRFNLPVLPAGDFPVMSSEGLQGQVGVDVNDLILLIDKTRFAISTEETRYYLNGVYMHAASGPEGRVLRCVATDGHRLARIDATLPEGAEDLPGVIVPRKTVVELRKLAEETQEPVEIHLSDTKIRFDLGSVHLTSKLIDGTFPEYDRVIPRGNDKVLRVRKKEFAEAVGRVAAISSERSRPVKLSLDRNRLLLSASSAEQGQAEEELDSEVVRYDAAPIEIGFQARYLNDITDQIGERVVFKFADGSAPTLVMDAEKPEALYVLMPMRV